MPTHAQRSSNVLKIVFSLLLLIGAYAVFSNRQAILDTINVHSYKPSPAISAISQRATFDDRGMFLFYASRPELLDRNAFNGACHSAASEQTAILGCYNANRIYLFNVANAKLDGVKEVTAAHEMLHAAYQRLSPTERAHVNSLLSAQDLGSDSDRIHSLIAEYARTEPGEELNELHSIIGSEVSSLNPALEAYYARYFKDRSALVRMASRYQSVFDELRARQDALAAELNTLADTIESASSGYKRDLAVLESDIRQFNARASSGTMTRATYDAERAELEARQYKIKEDYTAIQRMIESYEQKRNELAAINSESQALNRSINSSLPQTTTEELDG